MNKRQRKKKLKCIVDNIQKVNLNENDILIFKFDINKISVQQIDRFARYIKSNISNKFICIPNETQLIKVLDKQTS